MKGRDRMIQMHVDWSNCSQCQIAAIDTTTDMMVGACTFTISGRYMTLTDLFADDTWEKRGIERRLLKRVKKIARINGFALVAAEELRKENWHIYIDRQKIKYA